MISLRRSWVVDEPVYVWFAPVQGLGRQPVVHDVTVHPGIDPGIDPGTVDPGHVDPG